METDCDLHLKPQYLFVHFQPISAKNQILF